VTATAVEVALRLLAGVAAMLAGAGIVVVLEVGIPWLLNRSEDRAVEKARRRDCERRGNCDPRN
jgi:hypothetical protein